MPKYTVERPSGNISFEVTAKDREEALEMALEELGWNLFGSES